MRRKRVGDFRIIYRIDQARKEILVAFIARRNEERINFEILIGQIYQIETQR